MISHDTPLDPTLSTTAGTVTLPRSSRPLRVSHPDVYMQPDDQRVRLTHMVEREKTYHVPYYVMIFREHLRVLVTLPVLSPTVRVWYAMCLDLHDGTRCITTPPQLAQVTHLHVQQVYTALRALRAQDALVRVTKGVYLLNPYQVNYFALDTLVDRREQWDALHQSEKETK